MYIHSLIILIFGLVASAQLRWPKIPHLFPDPVVPVNINSDPILAPAAAEPATVIATQLVPATVVPDPVTAVVVSTAQGAPAAATQAPAPAAAAAASASARSVVIAAAAAASTTGSAASNASPTTVHGSATESNRPSALAAANDAGAKPHAAVTTSGSKTGSKKSQGSSQPDERTGGLSSALKIGLAAGIPCVVLLLAGVGCAAFFYGRRRRQERADDSDEAPFAKHVPWGVSSYPPTELEGGNGTGKTWIDTPESPDHRAELSGKEMTEVKPHTRI